MMVIDVFMFLKLHGPKCEFLFAMELITVLIYISVFVYMNLKGFRQLDEDVEFLLMCIRLTLQFFRLIFAIVRVSKVGKQRNETTNHNITIEIASKESNITDNEEAHKSDLIVV